MEYSRGEYKNKRGNVYTTTDGYKYTLSKERKSVAYLKCVLFREKCPSTAKLEMSINKITVICPHNHGVGQACTTRGPRAACGPQGHFIWPAWKKTYAIYTGPHPYFIHPLY